MTGKRVCVGVCVCVCHKRVIVMSEERIVRWINIRVLL